LAILEVAVSAAIAFRGRATPSKIGWLQGRPSFVRGPEEPAGERRPLPAGAAAGSLSRGGGAPTGMRSGRPPSMDIPCSTRRRRELPLPHVSPWAAGSSRRMSRDNSTAGPARRGLLPSRRYAAMPATSLVAAGGQWLLLRCSSHSQRFHHSASMPRQVTVKAEQAMQPSPRMISGSSSGS